MICLIIHFGASTLSGFRDGHSNRISDSRVCFGVGRGGDIEDSFIRYYCVFGDFVRRISDIVHVCLHSIYVIYLNTSICQSVCGKCGKCST